MSTLPAWADPTVDINDLVIPSTKNRTTTIRTYGFERNRDSVAAPVLWVHGGAFIGGGLDQLESHAVALALAARGRPVVTVDYQLSPPVNWLRRASETTLAEGIRYPAALDDVTAAFEWTHAHGLGALLGGASAGAALAASMILRNRDREQPIPQGIILAYGSFHAALPPLSPSLRRRIRGLHVLTQFRASTVDTMNLNYAGSRQRMNDPYALPGGSDLSGFPRTLMIDADRDSLRASGEAFHAELTEAGAHVEYAIVQRSKHGFLDRPTTQAFEQGIIRISNWLQE